MQEGLIISLNLETIVVVFPIKLGERVKFINFEGNLSNNRFDLKSRRNAIRILRRKYHILQHRKCLKNLIDYFKMVAK